MHLCFDFNSLYVKIQEWDIQKYLVFYEEPPSKVSGFIAIFCFVVIGKK